MIPKEKFEEVEQRIAGTRLKAEFIEADGSVVIRIPAGREERVGSFRDLSLLEGFLNQPFEKLNCVGPFAAVASYQEGWIESAIEFGTPFFGPSQVWHRALFGSNIYEGKEPVPIVLSSDSLTIRIQPASEVLRSYLPFFDLVRLGFGTRGEHRPLPSIRLESSSFSTNEAAADLLEPVINFWERVRIA